ncbi:DUF4468 domain-containing protein [Spirosoma radiotolerans]|uniref:DUF4468 domain-containing protein n=1 Tax=Spirosoma radiotolerans TaxID=1379870 RepID=A0A0E3ZS65_9BACT|nr:DUF4468 domain-containing protein [Spirosoma radiotolerans]AKD53978.1 hypothetical protein SD10_02700 [Spirosoma radiotolerans]
MKYLFILFLFVSISALAQVKLPTNEVGQVQYQELVRVPDSKRTARQLMEQVHSWATRYYPLGNEAEQQYDREHNILFVRTFYSIGNQSVRYTLTIETKFGRYRATITDLIIDDNGRTQPVRAVTSTVDELAVAADSTVKDKRVIEQIAADQAELYRQIDKACRETLANLKQSLTEN